MQGWGEQGWQVALGRLLKEVMFEPRLEGGEGGLEGCQEQHGREETISRPLSLRGCESKPSCPSMSLSPPSRAQPGSSWSHLLPLLLTGLCPSRDPLPAHLQRQPIPCPPLAGVSKAH